MIKVMKIVFVTIMASSSLTLRRLLFSKICKSLDPRTARNTRSMFNNGISLGFFEKADYALTLFLYL